MRIVHWVQKTTSRSGMHSYISQLVHVSRKMGLDCQIALSSEPEPQMVNLMLYDEPIQTIAHSECEAKDCVNVFHDGQPENFGDLPNKVYETHGTPEWIVRDKAALDYTAFMLQECDRTITRWEDQIPFWRAFTDKPILYTPPGVDLDYWKPEGKKALVVGKPVFLWADSWRDGMKEPWEFLYKQKMDGSLLRRMSIILINIPEEKRWQLNDFIAAIGLSDQIEAMEGQVKNVADYYRAADWLYSPAADNVRWEAAACGCGIWEAERHVGLKPGNIHDIKKSIEAQVTIFENLVRV